MELRETPGGRRPPAQAFDVPIDAHLHTDLSPDSGVPMELYAAQAFERRIPEIALTDHLDFLPGEPAYEYADYPRRERMIASSRSGGPGGSGSGSESS